MVSWVKVSNRNTVTNLYDNLDRPTFTYFPDGTYTQTIYDKLDAVRTKDRRGHWTARQYDKVRHVTDILDPFGRTTHFDWCGCGALESITDALGHTTTWNRDIQSRVTSKVYPDSSAVNYGYESTTSRLKVVTDALNQATVFGYNVDDTTAKITYTNAVIATSGITNTYDPVYNRISTMSDGTGTTTYFYNPIIGTPVLGAGQLAIVSNSVATITYQYDELGRVTNRAIDGVGVNSTFDALGRVTVFTNALGSFTNSYLNTTPRLSRVSYPNGQTSSFSYFGNADDQRLQTIANTNASGSVISKFDYTYDVDGQIKTWTQQADSGTPKVLAAEYDPVDQLLSVTVHSNSVIGAVLKEFVYNYDQAGNRTGEQIGASMQSAGYNNLNQLTNSSGGGPMRFKGHLDEIGTVTVGGAAAAVDHTTTNFIGFANVSAGTNTVPIIATDYSGNARTNNYQAVVSIGSEAKSLSYDANGNLTNLVSVTVTNRYRWDAANRLINLTQYLTNQTLTSEFYYDGVGRRIAIAERQNGSLVSSNLYVWCGTEICEERSSGNVVTKRFFGVGEQLSGTDYFFTKDHLGSIREMTDGGGTIHARYDYDPYGRRTKVSGDVDADFGFTGYYYHSVSGLSLTFYRQYDPGLGRWLSRDPIEENGGLNIYGFVGNNSINRVDLMGLAWYDDTAAYWQAQGNAAKNIMNNSGSVIVATVANSVIDVGVAVASSPAAIGNVGTATGTSGRIGDEPILQPLSNLGTGAGNFYENPSLENSTGLFQDISTTAGILALTLDQLPIGNAEIGWKGGELTFTRPGAPTPDLRINPCGGSGYPPHYHRRGPGGIKKHRPWQGGF